MSKTRDHHRLPDGMLATSWIWSLVFEHTYSTHTKPVKQTGGINVTKEQNKQEILNQLHHQSMDFWLFLT